MVLEAVPDEVATGPECDGQVLVSYDMLRLFDEFVPPVVKQYGRLANDIVSAAEDYAAEVGLTIWNLYFEMFPESIKVPQVFFFLRHWLRRIPGPLLIVWDGLAAHRSQLVRDYVTGLEGRIHLERLPAYAPELNPVEYVWAHLKQHELPNVRAKDLWSLGQMARNKLRRMRRRLY